MAVVYEVIPVFAPLIVVMEDDLLHTDEHPQCPDWECGCQHTASRPFCGNPDCTCHDWYSEQASEHIAIPLDEGLLTEAEASRIYYNQQV